jgi:hypothetical protein
LYACGYQPTQRKGEKAEPATASVVTMSQPATKLDLTPKAREPVDVAAPTRDLAPPVHETDAQERAIAVDPSVPAVDKQSASDERQRERGSRASGKSDARAASRDKRHVARKSRAAKARKASSSASTNKPAVADRVAPAKAGADKGALSGVLSESNDPLMGL